jgi:hypothetical protein
MEEQLCEHLSQLNGLKKSQTHVCDECVKHGGKWLHLRVCQTCGATLCCDSSPAKHATKHAMETGHPVVISAERGEHWAWCYADKMFMEY